VTSSSTGAAGAWSSSSNSLNLKYLDSCSLCFTDSHWTPGGDIFGDEASSGPRIDAVAQLVPQAQPLTELVNLITY